MKTRLTQLFVLSAIIGSIICIPNYAQAGRENGVWLRSTWEFPDLKAEERPDNMAEINGELMDSEDLIKNVVLGTSFGFTQDKDKNFKYVDPYVYVKILPPLQLGIRYHANSLSDTGYVGASGRLVKDIEFATENQLLLFGEITGYSETNDEKDTVDFTTGKAEIALQFSKIMLGADYKFRMDDYRDRIYQNYFGGKIGVKAKGILFFIAGGKNYVNTENAPDEEYSVIYAGIELANKKEPKRYKFFWEYGDDEKKEIPQRNFPAQFKPSPPEDNKQAVSPVSRKRNVKQKINSGNTVVDEVISDPEEVEYKTGAEKINYKMEW